MPNQYNLRAKDTSRAAVPELVEADRIAAEQEAQRLADLSEADRAALEAAQKAADEAATAAQTAIDANAGALPASPGGGVGEVTQANELSVSTPAAFNDATQ